MLKINKLRADHVIDFAAEELKKYLRMMMPEAGDVTIAYDPAASDGFRLGLAADFGLTFDEVQDVKLDDVVHIDADGEGGILAGSNPRSVLFSVYRFFKENGCRWLYPGLDGEHIPVRDVQAVQYHKMADHRFRGHCNEGAESQQCMMETIEFYAKMELNVYMIEFDTPFYYYDKYYSHKYNENRPPEPITAENVKQWKRLCEVEIAKRGLMFHDMGHGWTAEPFGLDSTDGWKPADMSMEISEETRNCLAMIDGVRQLWGGVALNTNLCMSNPKVQETMANAVVQYAESHQNVDYLHVWLADGSRNHCECPACATANPSDFYLQIMNLLDEKLTAKGMDTRIVFIAYVDTLWAPIKEQIKNPKRFSLLFAPITRTYTESANGKTAVVEPVSFKRNAWETPKSLGENLGLLQGWQKIWNGPCFTYEYHFWKHQYYDLGGLYLAKRIFEDIEGLKETGVDGYVEDGSQRSFFPNGLPMYVFAQKLLDRSLTFEEIVEDYYSHIYGADWKKVADLLKRMGEAFDFAYMSGEYPEKYYGAEHAERLQGVAALVAEELALAEQHLQMPTRPQTVSWRLLIRHAELCTLLSEAMILKAQGEDLLAAEAKDKMLKQFGRHEFEIERYFDHGLGMIIYNRILRMDEKKALVTGM